MSMERDADGWSELDRAAGAGATERVRALLDAGADPTTDNDRATDPTGDPTAGSGGSGRPVAGG